MADAEKRTLIYVKIYCTPVTKIHSIVLQKKRGPMYSFIQQVYLVGAQLTNLKLIII